ncbi:hypothetical protein KC573_00400 [candidate division WWE3 bacterium]|uniref:DUF5673 domain-containing protein n=1 Tax=candidate division WWE3 bacterium TaxID=2053526 RepID=A0A955LW36_UNCKA|nr:hypothetical protein [candidate division WWE3 bacterium]
MDDETNVPQPLENEDFIDEESDIDVRVAGRKHEKPRILLEWTGPSRVHVEREHNFFITLFVIAVALGFILVLMREYTLMLVVFALAFTVYAANKHEPKTVTYQITSTEVVVDGQHFPYEELESFWFDEEGGQTVLKIATNSRYSHYVDMVVSPDSREAIEDELLEYIPYQKVDEGRIIGFIRRLVYPIDNPNKTPEA